jgi:hypothetical protein
MKVFFIFLLVLFLLPNIVSAQSKPNPDFKVIKWSDYYNSPRGYTSESQVLDSLNQGVFGDFMVEKKLKVLLFVFKGVREYRQAHVFYGNFKVVMTKLAYENFEPKRLEYSERYARRLQSMEKK